MIASASVAVLDILRATTTLTAALQHGCQRIIPCASISEARKTARELRQQGKAVWLAGERGGKKIAGFDAGNSPLEFADSKNRIVVLTTSNGTRALRQVRSARFVLPVCLNNLAAAARWLIRLPTKKIAIVCAGEAGQASPEDSLVAGKLIQALLARPASNGWHLNAAAQAAWIAARQQPYSRMAAVFKTFPHARTLIRLGFAADVQLASRANCTSIVGHYTDQGIIRLGNTG